MLDKNLLVFDREIDRLILEAFTIPLTEAEATVAEFSDDFQKNVKDIAGQIKKVKTEHDLKNLSIEDKFRKEKFEQLKLSTGIDPNVIKHIVDVQNKGQQLTFSQLVSTAMDEAKLYLKSGQLLRDAVGILLWVILYYAIIVFAVPIFTGMVMAFTQAPLAIALSEEIFLGAIVSPLCNIFTEKAIGFSDDGVLGGLIGLKRITSSLIYAIPRIIMAIIPVINAIITKIQYIYDKTSVKVNGFVNAKSQEFFALIKAITGVISGLAMCASVYARNKDIVNKLSGGL